MIKKGKVITLSVRHINKVKADEIWLITNAGKNIKSTVRVKELAPSDRLFSKWFKEWKNEKPEFWWAQYREIFVAELKQNYLALEKLRELENKVKNGKVIALACYCENERYCHRTIIKDILLKKGVTAEEYKKEGVLLEGQQEQLTINFGG